MRGGDSSEGDLGEELFSLCYVREPLRLHTPGYGEPSSSVKGRALALLGAAEPYRSTVGRKERIWLRAMHRARLRPGRMWSPLVAMSVLTALIGSTAIAGNALGHWPAWAINFYERLVPKREAIAAAPESVISVVQRAPVSRAHPVRGIGEASPELAVAGAGALAGTASPRRDLTPSARPRYTASRLRSDDTALVSSALRALRQDRDPVRARGLLNSYLSAHPRGALAEEALAMSIEAAVTHHDSDAGALASRYLRLYPNGAFRLLGQQVLFSSESQYH
jgi:hypothetical protein